MKRTTLVIAAIISISMLPLFFNLAYAKKHTEYAPKAPLPQVVLKARSIFLVNNGGVDPAVKIDGAAVLYDYLYHAFSEWGVYEFAANPSEADLVVYVSYSAENPRQYTYSSTNYSTGATKVRSRTISDPTLRMVFVDSRSGSVVWEQSELRKKTRIFFGLGLKRRAHKVVEAAERLFAEFRDRYSQ